MRSISLSRRDCKLIQSRAYLYTGMGMEERISLKFRTQNWFTRKTLAKCSTKCVLKACTKKSLFLLDTCEAFSMFDKIEAPDIYMIATSKYEESAIASDTDSIINNFLSDNFSRDFFDFLHSPAGYANKRDFSMADFPK